MRILVVGKKQQMHWPENVYRFLPQGHQKSLFLYNDFSVIDAVYKVFCPKKRYQRKAMLFQKRIDTFHPDMILFISSFFIPMELYQVLQHYPHIQKIGWVADAFGKASYDKAKYLDLIFCSDTGYIQKNPKCPCSLRYLPLCADESVFKNKHQPHIRPPFFAGEGNDKRTEYLSTITTSCDIYGSRWDKDKLKQHNVHNQKLTHIEINACYQTTMAPINISFSKNIINGLNFRVFEIGCAGGLILLNECSDIHLCYRVGSECITYTTPKSLDLLIQDIVANPSKYEQIAERGYQRTLAEHTFTKRLEQMLAQING